MNSQHLTNAPINLGGLFCIDDSDADDDNQESQSFEQRFEELELSVVNKLIIVRQFSWHQANANQVWPGAVRLAQFIDENIHFYSTGKILELGAATGALAIFLTLPPHSLNVVTSDICDDGAVERNIIHNFQINGLSPVQHVPYSWGQSWQETVAAISPQEDLQPSKAVQTGLSSSSFKFIIASDILLYVSAYGSLVRSLTELFCGSGSAITEFVMSWNRRIAESRQFFDLMSAAGFACADRGHGVYCFTRRPPCASIN